PNLRRSPSYVPTLQEVDMSRTTALFVGIAALAVISTVAEAADGCGRGWYYNGRRCVPQDEPGYGYRRGYEDRGPVFGLISAAAGTSGDTPRRIRLLKPSTTARRLTQFRTGYVSRTQDLVRPS